MSNNISTFDLTKFKHSIHFEERALERFNVTSLQMKAFLKENSPVYDTHLSPIENRKQTLSKNGIMFILDVDKKEIVTVYKSISPQIAQTKQSSFQNELNQMIAKYQVATAQEYLQAVGENINRFNSVSQILMTSDPKHLNFNMVEQVFKDVTIIKSALKLLSKQNDFYQEFSNNYDPLKYLNFSDLDDLDEHFDTPKSFTPLPKMTETSVTEQLTLNEVIIEPQKLRVKTVEPKELSVKTKTTNKATIQHFYPIAICQHIPNCFSLIIHICPIGWLILFHCVNFSTFSCCLNTKKITIINYTITNKVPPGKHYSNTCNNKTEFPKFRPFNFFPLMYPTANIKHNAT